ncbi:MAG: glycosyltransferase family 4 protein [Anaerolineae bacterium]|nr:glycosyltransferase family 4 protein [Anaerolineae bacterium]
MTRVRVGLIVYGLDRPLSGISRYTVELARAMAALEAPPELVLLAAGEIGPLAGLAGAGRVRLPGCRLLPGLLTLGNLILPRLAAELGLDVLHDPTGVTPFLLGAGRARAVVTVHDVFAWSYPGTSTLLDTLIYRHWLPRVLPWVDAVITDSQASRADIIRYLRVEASRIHVVPLAASGSYRPASRAEIEAVRARHNLPERYVLFGGGFQKRKNLTTALHAYAQLHQMGERRPLVVVGGANWKQSRMPETLDRLGIDHYVVFAGYVHDADLPAVYSGADLFLFPSLYEGFGLPPLEAMACGTPVVCSNAASLPEVVGDAALLVDPRDVEGLTQAMLRVLTDAGLRQALRESGLRRAGQFSWERTARETVDVYQEVWGHAHS